MTHCMFTAGTRRSARASSISCPVSYVEDSDGLLDEDSAEDTESVEGSSTSSEYGNDIGKKSNRGRSKVSGTGKGRSGPQRAQAREEKKSMTGMSS